MKDKELAVLMGLKPVNKGTCLRCHTPDSPGLEAFDYEKKKQLILHHPAAKHAASKRQ